MLHFTFLSNITDTKTPHLYESVLRLEPGTVCRWPGVQGADVLSGPRPITVKVEAVAHLWPHQVAETWSELGWVDLGPRLGLGLGLSFSLGLLEVNGKKLFVRLLCITHNTINLHCQLRETLNRDKKKNWWLDTWHITHFKRPCFDKLCCLRTWLLQ